MNFSPFNDVPAMLQGYQHPLLEEHRPVTSVRLVILHLRITEIVVPINRVSANMNISSRNLRDDRFRFNDSSIGALLGTPQPSHKNATFSPTEHRLNYAYFLSYQGFDSMEGGMERKIRRVRLILDFRAMPQRAKCLRCASGI